jgi:hypothetical protein
MVHSIRKVQRVANKILFHNKSVGVFDSILIQLTSLKHMLYFVSIHKEEASNFRKKDDFRAQVSNTRLPELQTVYSQQRKAKRFNYWVKRSCEI